MKANIFNPMKIYAGQHLEISFDKSANRFSQNWTTSPETFEQFQHEMTRYTEFYEKYRPSQSIWNQKNFAFNLDHEHHLWIEEFVNIPCLGYGNKKLAFVVGEDVLAHLQVVGAFDNINSCIRPQHFASEELALEWLNDELKISPGDNDSTEIIYDGVDDEGRAIIRIISPQIDLHETLKRFSSNEEESTFKDANYEKFASLSQRELEVLEKFTEGLKTKEIADKLCISNHTVQTHWKSIKRKLELSHTVDIFKYLKFIK